MQLPDAAVDVGLSNKQIAASFQSRYQNFADLPFAKGRGVAKNDVIQSIIPAIGLYAVSLAAAWVSEILRSFLGTEISIWLPAGLLLAAALASPRSTWPIWAAAAIAAEFTGNYFWYQHQIGPAILLAFGNAFAALSGAAFLRYYDSTGFLLTSLRKVTLLLLTSAIIMPVLSATSASIALGWSYDKPLTAAWSRVFLGDFTGAIVAAPLALLVLGAAASRLQMTPRRWMEAIALLAVLVLAVMVSLGGIVPFGFVLFPPLLWAAVRFRIPGAVIATSAVSVLSVIFTINGSGPFARELVDDRIEHEILQLFMVAISITGLLIGALAEENRDGISKLQQANDELELRVEERSASLIRSEAQASATANLLSAIGEACPDLIYAKDLEHNIIYGNAATLQTLGARDLDELMRLGEQHYYRAPADYDGIRQNDLRVLDLQKTLIVEETITSPLGEARVYRTTKSPLYDANGDLAGLAGVSVDISDIKKSQARETMLVREVEHRSRNMLAVVQGIVALTQADDVADMRGKLGKRIRALAKTNGAIIATDWQGASLKQILDAELAPYRDENDANVELEGEDVTLDPATAQSFTLVIHELTTNAAKYGALSTKSGSLSIRWLSAEPTNKRSLLKFIWTEKGGPPVKLPDRKGFGTTVIGVFGQEHQDSDVDFAWDQSGLTVKLTVPLMQVA